MLLCDELTSLGRVHASLADTRLLSEGPDPSRPKHLLFASDSLPSAAPDRSPFVDQLREVAGGDVSPTFVSLDSAPSRELNRSLVDIDGVTQYYFESSETPLEQFVAVPSVREPRLPPPPAISSVLDH